MRRLEDIPNVGVAVADELRTLDITVPTGLVGRDPRAMYPELNARRCYRHDPCLLNTFISTTRFMAGEPARPWPIERSS